MDYIKRINDKEIDLKSEAFGGIQIVGPKGCGKTKTAKERCKTYIEFEDEKNIHYITDEEVLDYLKSIDLDDVEKMSYEEYVKWAKSC